MRWVDGLIAAVAVLTRGRSTRPLSRRWRDAMFEDPSDARQEGIELAEPSRDGAMRLPIVQAKALVHLRSLFTNFSDPVQYAKFFAPRSHSSFILHRLPFLGQQHRSSPSERRPYGYFADHQSSLMRTRNAGLSSLQGFGAGSERGIPDVSDMRSGDYTASPSARGARSVRFA